MKLLILMGVIVAGMSGCGATRAPDLSSRAIVCSPATAGHQAGPAATLAA
jgi:hypothetical protein